MLRTMLRTLAPTALLLAALTACSGSDDPDNPADASETASAPETAPSAAETSPAATRDASPSSAPEPDPAEELRAAVQSYSDAFLTGDGAAAYALLTARCRDRISEAEFTGVVDQAGEQYGTALELTTFDAEVSGNLARATYTYDVAEINQTGEPWAREAGAWLNDDC